MDNIYQSPFFRMFVVIFIMMTTFLYSSYERNKIELMQASSIQGTAVIKKMPEMVYLDWVTGQIKNTKEVAAMSKGIYVHFWGTWCGPCEEEFPAFLDYAAKFEDKNILFLLVAVKDEEGAVKKFLKRFKKFPANINFIFDAKGDFMDAFGTLKVPETFLFKKDGELVVHFPGPQDWAVPGMLNRTLIQLGL
jgi:thiol-disulfide isomerase/thioredoxin